ncbi:MAG: hypothetical protein E7258_03420 [Lachnospiraceae bacterium]|nr:hypothetical protein [Lachnospiraceae bacterium]
MEKGTLGELYLNRSVTKHIRKHNKDLICGGAVSSDCALFSVAEGNMASSEGWGATPLIAWVKAMNNLYAVGAKPVGVRIQMMLPCQVEESDIKIFMQEFNSMADGEDLQIMGGHTQVSDAYTVPTFFVSVLGRLMDYIPRPKAVTAGDKIIMTKWAGILGNDILVEKKQERLKKTLPESYVKGGFFGRESYQIKEESMAAIALDDKVCYMHDISAGGVYSGLWQLGARLGKGVRIDHYKIPIKQETIEFSQAFDINPYMLDGTGALLIVAKQGDVVLQSLGEKNIPATIIGEITQEKDRVVVLGEGREKRFLAPAKGDEIYKVVSIY